MSAPLANLPNEVPPLAQVDFLHGQRLALNGRCGLLPEIDAALAAWERILLTDPQDTIERLQLLDDALQAGTALARALLQRQS